jgi:hypothetical protein
VRCPVNETGCTFSLGLLYGVITTPTALQVLYYGHHTVILHRRGVLCLQSIRLAKNCTCGKLHPSARPIIVEHTFITFHMGIIPLQFYCAMDISRKQYPASPHPREYALQQLTTTQHTLTFFTSKLPRRKFVHLCNRALTTNCIKFALPMPCSFVIHTRGISKCTSTEGNSPISTSLKAIITHLKGDVTSFPAGLQTPGSGCHTIPTTFFYFQSILLSHPMKPSKPLPCSIHLLWPFKQHLQPLHFLPVVLLN